MARIRLGCAPGTTGLKTAIVSGWGVRAVRGSGEWPVVSGEKGSQRGAAAILTGETAYPATVPSSLIPRHSSLITALIPSVLSASLRSL